MSKEMSKSEIMMALYGENHEIKGEYAKDLAVTCHNGTFVGKETNGVIAYKGIPFAMEELAASTIETFGACHTIELPAVFGTLSETGYSGEPIDESFAKKVQEMWVNFAKTGAPSLESVEWKTYSPEERNAMVIGKEIKLESSILPEQLALAMPLVKYHFSIMDE